MNTKPNKSKIKVTNYENCYDSLTEMVSDLIQLHPEIQNIFHVDENVELLPRDLHDDALEYFATNAPIVTAGINLPVSLTITANGASIKTAKFFSLKWNFKYDRNGNISDITATITTFIKDESKVNKALSNMINLLEENWKVIK